LETEVKRSYTIRKTRKINPGGQTMTGKEIAQLTEIERNQRISKIATIISSWVSDTPEITRKRAIDYNRKIGFRYSIRWHNHFYAGILDYTIIDKDKLSRKDITEAINDAILINKVKGKYHGNSKNQ